MILIYLFTKKFQFIFNKRFDSIFILIKLFTLIIIKRICWKKNELDNRNDF